MNKKQKVMEILLKALKWEWTARDNARTASSLVKGWVEEIDKVYK
jgi:hypothetical protein